MAQGSGVVILALAAGLAVVYYGIRRYFAGAVCKSKAVLKGKTILITGANTGLGRATALELAKREARVILACRSLEKGHKAAEEIRSVVRGAVLIVMHLDLSCLASVRKFVDEFLSVEERLDILINNAGVYMDPPQATTQDGFELHFGVNHLGHFLLTNLLLDLLERSSPSRIVIVSSSLAKRARIDFDNIYGEKGCMGRHDHMVGPYAQSKLANLLFAHELNKRLPENVTVNSLCPGICWTQLHRNSKLSFVKKLMLYPIAMLVAKRPWEGAQTIIYCTCEESLQTVSGEIFVDCRKKEFPPHTRDDGVAKKLWELSETLTQLNQSSNSL